jgi:uncharacterized membrane protein YgcG
MIPGYLLNKLQTTLNAINGSSALSEEPRSTLEEFWNLAAEILAMRRNCGGHGRLSSVRLQLDLIYCGPSPRSRLLSPNAAWRNAMTRIKSLAMKFLIFGVGPAIALLSTTQLASAQVRCPDGYYYSDGYGCVPDSDGYSDMYGDYDYDSGYPAYDTFGLAYGYGYRGGHGGGGHGGGGHGGGGHGGGGHGGGHGH